MSLLRAVNMKKKITLFKKNTVSKSIFTSIVVGLMLVRILIESVLFWCEFKRVLLDQTCHNTPSQNVIETACKL